MNPPVTAGGEWTYSILHRFTSHIADGAEPTAGVVIAQDGTLYGTTLKGGTWGNGVVYKLALRRGTWMETVLYNFTGHGGDGAGPQCVGRLVLAPGEGLYGTTEVGARRTSGPYSSSLFNDTIY